MKSSSALTAAKTVFRWLRWAAVPALAGSALGALVYSAVEGRACWPAPLAAAQTLVCMLLIALNGAAVVVAGALIAPRFRLATAIVLAALPFRSLSGVTCWRPAGRGGFGP